MLVRRLLAATLAERLGIEQAAESTSLRWGVSSSVS
jgi:hypothetical protein